VNSDNSSRFNFLGVLTANEAAELAAGIAELTKIGLPLPAGLRALADEWPTRRLRPVLIDLANQVDRGVSLEDAINSVGTRLPAHLRGLIIAGLRSGRLADALEQYVNLQRTQHDLHRQVWLALSYPTLLMILMCFLAIFANFYITHPMVHIFRDFGTGLPALTQLVIKTSGPLVCVLIIVTALMLAIPMLSGGWPGSAWISPFLYPLPIIGPTLKWSQMSLFSRLMGMLLKQQVPLPDALRLAAQGLSDAYLARACRKAAADVEKGRPFNESMASRRQFSSDLIPLVELGQRTSMLADAFLSAVEMFEGRTYLHGRTLATFLLPATFLLILGFYGFFIIGIMLPLISLITRLSSGQ